MKMYFRIGAVMAAALVVLPASLTGCASSGGGGNAAPPTIALLMPDTSQPRYELHDRPDFEAAVKKLCDECVVLYSNAGGDSQTQQEQAESAITNGAKVIAINPLDVEASAAIGKRAADAGVKVISMGRLIQNAPVDYTVSVSPTELGTQQGESLVTALKASGHPNGPIVTVAGDPADNAATAIRDGALAVFKDAGVEVAMSFDTPKWAPETAQTEMDQAITRLGANGFAGVYASNDGMAGGVIAAMKAASIDPKTRPVTGLDADVAALQRIVTGEQYMTQYIDINDQAEKSAATAVAIVKGEPVDTSIFTDTTDNGWGKIPTYLSKTTSITLENMKSELFDNGYVSRDDVCTDAFAAACDAAGI